MKNSIQINLGTDHALECTEKIIGRAGEGLVSRLEITVPKALTDYDAFIDFEKPNGEVLRTPKLEVENGVAYYDVPQYLLFESGEIKVQIVFIKGKISWKSTKKRYTILKSINASEDIPDKEDFISQAQAILDELSGEVQEIADMLANNADFAQSVIEACGGQTQITTINGKTLRFFADTEEEYNKLSDYQKQNLFAIITDDKTKEAIFNAIAELTGEIEAVRNYSDNITKGLVNGDFVVAEATHAGSADSASFATHAGSADSAGFATDATNATNAEMAQKDGAGNEFNSTYAKPSDFGIVTAGSNQYIDAPLGSMTVLTVRGSYEEVEEIDKGIGLGQYVNTDKILVATKMSSGWCSSEGTYLVDSVGTTQIKLQGKWVQCGRIEYNSTSSTITAKYLIQRVL